MRVSVDDVRKATLTNRGYSAVQELRLLLNVCLDLVKFAMETIVHHGALGPLFRPQAVQVRLWVHELT